MAAARSSNYSASLSASYQLDFWGGNRDALQSAEETAIANRFDRDVVALTTLTAVANAYFQVLASQDRLRTAERNIASAQRILDAIKERRKAGTGTDLDVAQQESVLANQKASVPPLRQTLDQNINALAVLVSRPPESLHVTGGSLDRVATPRVTPGLPSELLTQRPDIRRQEAQLASATANIGNARAQFFPSIQLTGQGGYQSSALVSLFQPHAAFFSLVGAATQPIFDGGKILGNFEWSQGPAGRIAADLPQDRGAGLCRRRQCALFDQADHDQARAPARGGARLRGGPSSSPSSNFAPARPTS